MIHTFKRLAATAALCLVAFSAAALGNADPAGNGIP